MITVFTQSGSLINMTNFNSIMCVYDEQLQETVIALDGKYILGRYNNDIPQMIEIINWMAKSISSHKSDDNLCFTMPLQTTTTDEGDNNAEND